ncbi:MAG: hypothetical protein JNK49_03515 [Planctomycetes bacterium]|nr:hypothetical protein [Planctomycetota bacterium]
MATVPLLALLVTGTVAFWPRPALVPAPEVPPAPAKAAAGPAVASAGERATLLREPAAPAGVAPRPQLDFGSEVEALVSLGEATSRHVQADEIDLARNSDAAARQRFDGLLAEFQDAGERSLDLLVTLPAGSTEPRDTGRRLVLQLVLQAEIARRHEVRDEPASSHRSDALVAALLRTMPAQEPLARLGERVLAHQPFLHLCHEPEVLQLVQQASRGEVPREVATSLLSTLWDNLQRRGERSSAELANLALVLLADPDPSQRTAACRQLLLDGRFRGVVLAWLREHRDHAVASELANIAARELPAKDALAVLREVAPILGSAPQAYMVLGMRDTAAVADAYRELLAGDQHAAVRVDLLAGLATGDRGEALPLLEQAQTSDPSPRVRAQALLTITSSATESHGTAALERALGDPALRSDPHLLGMAVMALQNLEVAGLTNAVDRFGQQLRSLPLREDTRNLLEQLLAHSLPGGLTSDQWSKASRATGFGGNTGSREATGSGRSR